MRDKLIGKLRCSQAAILVFCIINGGLFGSGINVLIKTAEEDIWLSTILGILLGFIPFYMFISFSASNPDKNIFEIIESIFGKICGKVIVAIITIFAISFVLFSYWHLTNLISSQYLYKTPQLFIYILFAIPIIYILSKGIKVALRSITIIFFITILLYLITFISLVPQVKIINLFPILKDGISPVIRAAIGYIAYSVVPTIFLGAIPVHYYEDKENYKKYMIISYIVSSIAVFVIPFLIMTIFGIDLAKLYQYPEFQILRRVSIGGFIERIESTLSVQWIFVLFILITMGMYFIKQGIYHIFRVKNNYIKLGLNGLFLVISVLGSLNFFKNNTMANQFSIRQYPFVCYGFLVFFSIIYIVTLIKKKRNS